MVYCTRTKPITGHGTEGMRPAVIHRWQVWLPVTLCCMVTLLKLFTCLGLYCQAV